MSRNRASLLILALVALALGPARGEGERIRDAVMCRTVSARGHPVCAQRWFPSGARGLTVWFRTMDVPRGAKAEVRWVLNGAGMRTRSLTLTPQRFGRDSLVLPLQEPLPDGLYEAVISIAGHEEARARARVGGEEPPADEVTIAVSSTAGADATPSGIIRADRTPGIPPPLAPITPSAASSVEAEAPPESDAERAADPPSISGAARPVLPAAAESTDSGATLPSAAQPQPPQAPATPPAIGVIHIPTADEVTGREPLPADPAAADAPPEDATALPALPLGPRTGPRSESRLIVGRSKSPAASERTGAAMVTRSGSASTTTARAAVPRSRGPGDESHTPAGPGRAAAAGQGRPTTMLPNSPSAFAGESAVRPLLPAAPPAVPATPVEPARAIPREHTGAPVAPADEGPAASGASPPAAPPEDPTAPATPPEPPSESDPDPIPPIPDAPPPTPALAPRSPLSLRGPLEVSIVAEDLLEVELSQEAVKLYHLDLQPVPEPPGIQPLWVIQVPDGRFWPPGIPTRLGLHAGDEPDPGPADLWLYSDHIDGVTPIYEVPLAEVRAHAARENDAGLLYMSRDMYDERREAWQQRPKQWHWMWFAREISAGPGDTLVGCVIDAKRSRRVPEGFEPDADEFLILLDETGRRVAPVQVGPEMTRQIAARLADATEGLSPDDVPGFCAGLKERGVLGLSAWTVPTAGRYQVWAGLALDKCTATCLVWTDAAE